MYKLGCQSGEGWKEHSFSAIFECVELPGGISRLVAGVPHGNAEVFERLVASLAPPYYLLYILHTPRGEGEAGRYQSPKISLEELHEFVARFKTFLAADARFDLWAYSPEERATVAWDRHNMLYAYGPLEKFSAELRAVGYENGKPEIPSPHQHHYRQEMDAYAKELLTALDWVHGPLHAEDEQ